MSDEGQRALYAQTTTNSRKSTARLSSNNVYVVTWFALVCSSGRSPLLSRPAWLLNTSVGNGLKTRLRSSKCPERGQCVYKSLILINITLASPTYSIGRLPECPCASLLVGCLDTAFYRSVHPVKNTTGNSPRLAHSTDQHDRRWYGAFRRRRSGAAR